MKSSTDGFGGSRHEADMTAVCIYTGAHFCSCHKSSNMSSTVTCGVSYLTVPMYYTVLIHNVFPIKYIYT